MLLYRITTGTAVIVALITTPCRQWVDRVVYQACLTMRKRRNFAHGTRRQETSCNSIGSHELKYMSSDISDGGFRAVQRRGTRTSFIYGRRKIPESNTSNVKANDVMLELILSRDCIVIVPFQFPTCSGFQLCISISRFFKRLTFRRAACSVIIRLAPKFKLGRRIG
ncbi:hypothetical protein IW261DRAFT_636390 [Armillaria novae-zelandiae]|uniref:Uncharacterized protein n=1 Tax=Armillaria novae-zelandiae TaxID=153914 RepID=A0AA39UHJ1_9AGAR|nr:hypothetical protein IW261DRAFT_636390 [Armillaria novae-zelandiae]